MLNQLSLEGAGHAQQLSIELRPRLNFLTDDKGLGKSFVLNIAYVGTDSDLSARLYDIPSAGR